MGIIQEFKAFAMRGNVVDLAVGVIIGGAFGKIVSSLVADVIMPPIGILTGGIDFKDMSLTLKAAGTTPAKLDEAGVEIAKAVDYPAVTLNYGNFINETITFLIVAFAVFMLVKVMNTLQKKEEAAPAPAPKPTKEQELLGEIRDLLKKK